MRRLRQARIHIVCDYDPQYRPVAFSMLVLSGRIGIHDVRTMLQLEAGTVQQEYVPPARLVPVQNLPQLLHDLVGHLPA